MSRFIGLLVVQSILGALLLGHCVQFQENPVALGPVIGSHVVILTIEVVGS